MDMHQPEASSSTGPPPTFYKATLVFDSGLSRERFSQLIETNGVVHKLVLRLMEKCSGETTLRIGLVITAQEAAYPDPRALHSVIPAYRQDFRRPSALLTSLPALVTRFSPQAALNRVQPGSLLSDIWDIEDGAGLSISSSEPGRSDYFLSGLVTAIELLEHHSLPNTSAPPGALQSLSPPSALPMLSMVYKPHTRETQQSHLVVFTEKASLAAIDSDSRGSQSWARGDSSAVYDDVDWNTIGDRCKLKGVACSCVIAGSGEQRRGSSTPALGRDGSASAEKLRKMCQTSTADTGEGQDEPWFPLPPDSEAYLTGFAIKVPLSPPAEPAAVATEGARTGTAAGSETYSDAQLKYQLAQKHHMALKMSQAAQQTVPGQGNYNVLASLLASGRLDPNIMAQLVASVRSEDPAVRATAMKQLSSLMSLQKQSAAAQQSSINSVAQATGALSNAGGGSGLTPQQQQQFIAAMQQRAAAAAALQQGSQHNSSQNQQAAAAAIAAAAASATSANISGQRNTTANSNANNNQQQTAAAQQFQRQQLLLQQQRASNQAGQPNQNAGAAGTAATGAATGTPAVPRPNHQRVWTGTISWTMRTQNTEPAKWVIPVDCMLLSTGTDASLLQTNMWPQNLEMTGMSQMNMSELQSYVKANQVPCVLFTVSPQADNQTKSKMAYLTMSLGSKSLCAFIRFGGPGCGILLISSNQQSNSTDKIYRLLGVVCLKVPFNFPSNNATAAVAGQGNNAPTQQGMAAAAAIQQSQQPQGSPAVRHHGYGINGPTGNGTPLPAGANLTNPSLLQHAQLQSQLMQAQQNAQNNNQQHQTPQQQQIATPQQHARTPSQTLGTPHSQGMQTPQQNTHQRLPSQPQIPSTTLQQFAAQPNTQAIQQLHLRQLQAQAKAQQSGFPSQNQNAQVGGAQGAQQQQQQQQPQQAQAQAQVSGQAQQGQQQSANGQVPVAFTPQQRMGIIKLLRDAGMSIDDNFDPNVIPRDALVTFMHSARQKQQQAALAAAQQNAQQQPQPQQPSGAGAGGGVAATAMAQMKQMGSSNFNINGGNPQSFGVQQQQQPSAAGQQQPNPLSGLQLGQFAGLSQFQAAQAAQAGQNQNGVGTGALGDAAQTNASSALGLFAAQQGLQGGLQGLNMAQFQQQVGLGQFQQQQQH